MWYENFLTAHSTPEKCDYITDGSLKGAELERQTNECIVETWRALKNLEPNVQRTQLQSRLDVVESPNEEIRINSQNHPVGALIKGNKRIIIDGREILKNGGEVLLGLNGVILKIKKNDLDILEASNPLAFQNNTVEQNKSAFDLKELGISTPEQEKNLQQARKAIDDYSILEKAKNLGVPGNTSLAIINQRNIETYNALPEEKKAEHNRYYLDRILPQQEKIWGQYFPDFTYQEFLTTSVKSNIGKATKGQFPNAEQNERQQKHLASNYEKDYLSKIRLPNKDTQATPQTYIDLMKDNIINNPPAYLQPSENGGDEFYEVILFLKDYKAGKPTKLSPKGYQILHDMVGDADQQEIKNKYAKKVQNLTKRAEKERTKKNFHMGDFNVAQIKIVKSHEAYQLSMMEIAQEVKTIIDTPAGQKNEQGETIEVSGKQKYIKEYEEGSAVERFIKNISTKDAKGYQVKNAGTDSVNIATAREIVGKANLENAALYYVANNWGILTTVANFLVALGNGNWEGAFPYMAAGAAVTYGSAMAVKNSWLDKLRDPEDMPKWIAGELGNSGDYKKYYSNPWEVALVDNINWKKKSVKDAFSKEKKADKRDFKKKKDGKEGLEAQESAEKAKKSDVINQTQAEDFSDGKAFGELLTDPVRGPNGEIMTKEDFLNQLKYRGEKSTLRYEMLSHVASRIGSNDDILPHLHSMHHYALKP